MRIRTLILYRDLEHQKLFDQMRLLLSALPKDGDETVKTTEPIEPTENAKSPAPPLSDPWECAGQLIDLAATHGFEGNLWHCFLAYCLAGHENAYSTSCEITGRIEGSINQAAAWDFKIFKELFDCDITRLDRIGKADQENGDTQGGRKAGDTPGIWAAIAGYWGARKGSRVFNRRIRDQIEALAVSLEQAEDVECFANTVTEFYRRFGVGKFGLHKAFRVEETGRQVEILPITRIEHIYLNDIIGYELQKKKLIENTEAFLNGQAANNVLLFGDSGTGKSSSIKAILNEYYDQGLRMIEIYKHQFKSLSEVQEQIKDRNYKFIIYMDDLSFEESELEYKYLKAIIEGGLGKKPQNVLIYATSNRRHLIREKFSDKRQLDDELHNNDTVQEKLSLVARFGVTIYFGSPDKRQFQEIVRQLAERYQVNLPLEELYAEAGKWELSHGGLSGRTASQFIIHLLGQGRTKNS